MLHIARHAFALFLEGKLFRDIWYFSERLAISVVVIVALMLVASLVVKSVIVLALIGGFVGGAIQPYLFAGVKYQ